MGVHVPLMANVQSIEDTFKGLILCETQNRDDITSSFMASACSYFAHDAKESLQEDEDFINLKFTNEDAQELYGIKLFNKNLLFFPMEINKEEHNYCYDLIEKANHIK